VKNIDNTVLWICLGNYVACYRASFVQNVARTFWCFFGSQFQLLLPTKHEGEVS